MSFTIIVIRYMYIGDVLFLHYSFEIVRSIVCAVCNTKTGKGFITAVSPSHLVEITNKEYVLEFMYILIM